MPIESEKSYHVKVKALGTEILLFLDDRSTPKIRVNDSEFQDGAIGLRGYRGKTLIFEKVHAIYKVDSINYKR